MPITSVTLEFLAGVRQSPDKAWLDQHRLEYATSKAEFQDLVAEVASQISSFDKTIKGFIDAKIYRLNRDIRFSKDKTPYKHHFGAFISPLRGKGATAMSGYYIHIEPGNSFSGGGMYDLDTNSLFNLRSYIASNLTEFEKIITSSNFKKYYTGISDFNDALKSSPRGFTNNDPAIKYIKQKHYTTSTRYSDKQVISKDFVSSLVASFKALKPLNEFLNQGTLKKS